jgi:hypothetical protein
MTTYSEHLEWCKERAYKYIDKGDLAAAWNSFSSDMRKHRETAANPGLELGHVMVIGGQLARPEEMRKFISDFA